MDPGEFIMINIVCLKWGSKYNSDYVNKLYSAVDRNTSKSFKFWCVTENTQGLDPNVRVIDLDTSYGLEIWWNKIMLFSDSMPFAPGEQIFYVDLDTLITGNIDHMLTDEVPDIVVLRDFYHGIAKTASNIGSGLMSWKHGAYNNIWSEFIKDPQAAIRSVRPHGDQHWIESQIRAWYYWQDLFPDQVVSFKVHCGSGLPQNAKIVCYHGKPSIPDSAVLYTNDYKWKFGPQPWVLDHWRES